MTNVDINTIKKEMLETVRNNFKKFGEIIPFSIIFYVDGTSEILTTEFHNVSDKQIFADFVKKYCVEKNPIALMFVSEAYSLAIPQNRKAEYLDDKGNLKVNSPQENDEAIPIIICSFETKFTSEVIIMKTKNVGGLNLILNEERRGKMIGGIFKDLLSTPIGMN